MKKYIIFMVLFYMTNIAFSQNSAPVVDNVTFSQRTDSSFIVDVYYDLDGNTMSVLMLVSADYGSTWNFSCDSISGAIGCNILSGYGKHIVWDFGAEHPGTNGNKFRVKIYADDRNNEKGKVTDIDGNIYITTKIGDQWWMAENLKVTHYNNGDSISNVTDNSEWGGLTTGAYCNYNNDSTRVSKYGRLYNWYAVDDSRGIAPAGWHVPTDEDWKELEMFLGMSQSDADIAGYRGTDEGGKLKETGTIHWNSPNTGATNSSGFTTLPGGYRYYVGAFSYMGVHCLLWSSDEGSSTYAWSRELDYGRSGVGRFYDPERNGFSVRCVRD